MRPKDIKVLVVTGKTITAKQKAKVSGLLLYHLAVLVCILGMTGNSCMLLYLS